MPNTYKISYPRDNAHAALAARYFLAIYGYLLSKSGVPDDGFDLQLNAEHSYDLLQRNMPQYRKIIESYASRIEVQAVHEFRKGNYRGVEECLQILEGTFRAVVVHVRKNKKNPGHRTSTAAAECRKAARRIFKNRQKFAEEAQERGCGYNVARVKIKRLTRRLKGEPVDLPKMKASGGAMTRPALKNNARTHHLPRRPLRKQAVTRHGSSGQDLLQGKFDFH